MRCLLIRATGHTQVLDFSIFSLFRTKLRNALNERILAPTGSLRNDIYTLCELIHNAYKESVTYSNIINGFRACGVWYAVRRRAIPEVIKITDISNIESYGSRQDAFESFLSLRESYKATRNLLRSDGPVLQNGTLNTKGGLLLTSDDVLRHLAEREAAREAAAQVRLEREATAEKRRCEREREAQERVFATDKMERARIAHEKWMSERSGREMQRKISRAGRRATARHSTLRLSRLQLEI